MKSKKKIRFYKEKFIELVLLLAASSSIFITFGIVSILVYESTVFFKKVPFRDFLFDTQWTPLFAEAHYGIMPLVCGTLVTTMVALLVAIPAGTIMALYLSEYASYKSREIIKPALELLSAIPTVVYGYF
ncbi:MAG: hypothetical protein ACD_73C00798G0001, partial [uncultured bacterium]